MVINKEVTIKSTYHLLDQFLNLSKSLAQKHPAIVVILMHEYFRNMYPDDPFINSRYAEDVLTNIYQCLKNNIIILEAFEKVGSYLSHSSDLNAVVDQSHDDIARMSSLFGSLEKIASY